MTNEERIKGMSSEKLAMELEWFISGAPCYVVCAPGGCPESTDTGCAKRIQSWLQQEADQG
jgi:hypothetical protein